MSNGRVVILGGGVIGMCAAWQALRRGFSVTLVEREEAGGDNCSMGNAGMIVPSHFIPLAAPGMLSKGLRWMFRRDSPFYVKPRLDPALARWGLLFQQHANEGHVERSKELLRDLNLESRRMFAEFDGEEDFGLVKRGLLMLCKTSKGLDEEAEVAEMAREIGIQAEVVDASAAAKLDPGITMDIAGAVHFPQDCHLDPARFMAAIRKRVLALGATIESGVEVDGFRCQGGKVTALTSGLREFSGDQFVIAGGSWTADLLRKLRVKIPLQAGKGYSLTLPEPAELPELCSIFVEAKVAVTPMGGSLRFAGTMEVGGLDLSVDPVRVGGIIKSVAGYFPKFGEKDFTGVKPWAGLRPVSPDGLPYIGRLSSLPNVVVATGHAMMGLSLGPVTGRVVGELLSGERPFRDVSALDPERFS